MCTKRKEPIWTNRISERGRDGIFVKQFGSATHGDVQSTPHRDDFYMFGILLSGAVTITIDFKEISLKPGDVVLVTPGQVHHIILQDDDSTGYVLGLSPDQLSEAEIETISRYSLSPKPFKLDNEALTDAKSLFEIIHRRCIGSLAKAIVTLLLGYVDNITSDMTNRYTAIFIKFKQLLDSNLIADKQPSKYARLMNISEVYLNEAVKATTGLNVSRFILTQVVLNAKRLFINTPLNAKQIAIHLGYEDYAYFSRVFKKIAGVSPIEFRKNLR